MIHKSEKYNIKEKYKSNSFLVIRSSKFSVNKFFIFNYNLK